MPRRTMQLERQQVIALLSEQGEMKYTDFVTLLRSRGMFEHVQTLPKLYLDGLTVQRVVLENDQPVLYIKAGGA